MQKMGAKHSKEFDEVANEVVKAEEDYFKNNPVEKEIDRYAKYFHIYGEIFTNRVNKLSRRGLVRTLNALAKGPLTESTYHRTREEKEAVMIGMKLQEAVMFMTLHSAQQQADAAVKKATEQTELNNKLTDGVDAVKENE